MSSRFFEMVARVPVSFFRVRDVWSVATDEAVTTRTASTQPPSWRLLLGSKVLGAMAAVAAAMALAAPLPAHAEVILLMA